MHTMPSVNKSTGFTIVVLDCLRWLAAILFGGVGALVVVVGLAGGTAALFIFGVSMVVTGVIMYAMFGFFVEVLSMLRALVVVSH